MIFNGNFTQYVNDMMVSLWDNSEMRNDWLDQRLSALKPKGKSKSGLAAELGLSPARVTEIIGGARQIAVRELRPMAAYLEWTLDRLLAAVDNSVVHSPPMHSVRVIGWVQAGQWRDALEWSAEDQYEIQMPANARYSKLPSFGLEVRGPSMDEVYPDGSVVECVMLSDLGRDARPGERVICLRRVPHGMEATIKELRRDDMGGLWLWPRSTSPDFQQPWRVPNGDPQDDNEDLRVVALVVGSYRPEP